MQSQMRTRRRPAGVWGAQPTIKLKCFNLHKSYIAIAKKKEDKQTKHINSTMSVNGFNGYNGYNRSHGTWPENQAAQQDMDLQYCCEQDDVLDTSRFVMEDGYGSDSSSEESYEDYYWTDLAANCVTPPAAPAAPAAAVVECTTPPAVKTKAELKLQRSHEEPCFDINDPLRYCLDMGYISRGEYDRWKIVKLSSSPIDRTRRALDFGPGYNSDSESDGETTPATSSVVSYGTGYMQDSNGIAYDPWFPNYDYKSGQGLWCVVFENDPNDLDSQPPASISNLNTAFGLKIMWERFAERKQRCTLQEFWQTNALDIYEALQELVAVHAELFNTTSAGSGSTPEFHTTPVEMLEHTFETIGRMSRCIAEDFNTDSCVNYVEEFVRALYTELRYVGLRPPLTPTGDSVPR
jgi:hypothetical protein